MAADQQFCLRWNNHQSTLISVFDTLLENGTLVDCTLAAEGQYLKAHKVVLSACSPYMETLLSQNYDKHPILILKDVKFTELKSMMDYMYRGEVNISQDQLGTFLKAAESLQIKGLSENGEGDARDVGSTNANPPPPRRPPATRPEPEAAQSPAHRSRDGSVSPSSRKRRRLRRNSDDGDNHIESNSCDVPAQSTPVPNIPASITTTPIRTPIVKPEVNDRLDHNTLPAESGLLKEKIEPAEPLLEPKTEYLEDLNNDDSVEDLTLDDDDEMDMSQMSNLSNMSRPGPSHGADLSNQGFPPWQLGNQSGTDEVFMAAQEAVNAHRDSQDWINQNLLSYYGYMNEGVYKHFLTPYDNDMSSVKSDEFDESSMDPSMTNIKPRKTKFTPQSYHSCPDCGKWYRSKTSLGLHRRLECGKEPAFQCPFCPLKTHQKGNLQVHIKKKHSVDSDPNQSLKNKNPILAQELGMTSTLNPQHLGINREISSELTITRSQPMNNHLTTKTPNLSHILSQPNKARGITQFPQTVAEINASSSRQQFNDHRTRYKAPVSIPPGISVSRRRVSQNQERNFSELTITPTIVESAADSSDTLKPFEFKDVSKCESGGKQGDKKLPELTRILNSQAPPAPVILDAFSISNDAAEALIEEVDPLADTESKDNDEKDKDKEST